MDYRLKYQSWCESDAIDEDTKKELLALSDEKEIEDRFYKDLEFGTAGLRGIMGAGTNRINAYTVGKATLGLARYLLENFPQTKEKGVAIGYDTRNHSAELARNAANVLTHLGILVYLFDQAVPTPALSFAVRHFACVSGIVITASHNPSQYNGYKVFDQTGCQLGIQDAQAVLENIEAISDWSEIPKEGDDTLLTMLSDETLDQFTTAVLRQSTFKDTLSKRSLRLVYTPLHGTGRKSVLQILEKDGFSQVITVKEQEMPNGDFPTVKSPNPEERGSLEMGIALAKQEGADLVIGTDPDADRIGCAAFHRGEIQLLTGNQVGALLVDFLLKTKTVLGENPVLVTTVVTSDLGKNIAEKRGCQVQQVLTGFKFIGGKVTEFEMERERGDRDAHHFLFGYEESYGYLAGSHVRDKDAVVASMLISEMAAYHKAMGRTLIDALEELYREFGFYLDAMDPFTFHGKEGFLRIQQIMAQMREDPSFLPGVRSVQDFSKGEGGLPPSNVLKFILDGGSWVAARPSGTEPKIKFYYAVREENREKATQTLKLLKEAVLQKTKA